MKIGSLVECVKVTAGRAEEFGVSIPKVGNYYTIRNIRRFKSRPGVVLEEIVNKPIEFRTGIEEPYFPIEFFRELQPPIANIEEHINANTLEPELI